MSARPNAPLDAASMSDRRSPPRHARGEPPARDRGGAGAAPAVPPGMGARETPNGPPKHSTSNWGRGAPRAPVGGTPAGERAQGYAPNAPTSALGRQPSSEGRRPSMFDYARRGDDRGAPPPPPPPGLTTPGSAGLPPVATMGRVNAAPRPGFDVAPPPGMGGEQRARPSLLASVRSNERPSLLSQQRPPAMRLDPQRSFTGAGSSGLESGELASVSGGVGTPTPTSDATPKKRKLGGWGQALARAKTPTTASGTDAPSALRDDAGGTPMDGADARGGPTLSRGGSRGSFEDLRGRTVSPALTSTPKSDRGGWGAAAARAQATTPATIEAKATPKADPETAKKAKAAEQRLKVTKEALLSQMERVDGEVASLEKELEVLKKSNEEEKLDVATGSKDDISRQKKGTEAMRQRLSNAERAAQRAQDYATSKMREASVLLRETSAKRAQRRSAEAISRVNKDVAVFAAGTIQKMMQRQETRRERIERDFARNKKSAADAVDRIKRVYGLPLAEDVERVDFDAIVRRAREESETESSRRVASVVQNVLQQRKNSVAQRHYTNAIAYLKQREKWRIKIVQDANDKLAKESVSGKGFTPGSRASGRNRSTNDLNSGVARSEYEEMQMIKALQRKEELRHMTTIPDMILDPEELRYSVFDSLNGLVEDPVAERDRLNLIRPWTKAEKTIFHEKFAAYGKNFRRISQHLEGRDTGDCVMYYYKFQKTDDGFRGRRRAAMKKRRAYADAQRMRQIDPATIEAQREERAAPTAEARLERAALAAAAKAAKAKARAEKAKAKAAKEAEEAKQNANKTPSKGPEWTDMEKTKFVSGLLQYGKDFVAISSTIRTRSLDAVEQFYEDNRELMDLDSLIGAS